jgi:hypothetical protein
MEFIDVVTIAIILIVVSTLVGFVLWLASVPGKVARARGHAQVDAVTAAGWLSLLTLLTTWPLVLVWAYFRPIAVRMADRDEATPPRQDSSK